MLCWKPLIKTEMLILNLALVALVGKGAWQQMEEKGFAEKLEEEKTVKLGNGFSGQSLVQGSVRSLKFTLRPRPSFQI